MATTISPNQLAELETLDIPLGAGSRLLAYTGRAPAYVSISGSSPTTASESFRILLDVPDGVVVQRAIASAGLALVGATASGWSLQIGGLHASRDDQTGRVQVMFEIKARITSATAQTQVYTEGVLFTVLAWASSA